MESSVFLDRKSGMPCYKITSADTALAEKQFKQMFQTSNLLNDRTIYDRKESRIVGILGEIVFKVLHPDAQCGTDLENDFLYKGYKIDVKSKCRNVIPMPDFQACVYLYQIEKDFDVDIYYFMSATRKFDYMWLCGYIEKEKLLKNPNAKYLKKGDVCESNGLTYKFDSLSIDYKYLNKAF